ncbi:MAG: hypothetical protein KJ914_18785 [Gammaproteobacteria bacterium]|nr:hypothetical protein [Gammaproteobacteria bacterium]
MRSFDDQGYRSFPYCRAVFQRSFSLHLKIIKPPFDPGGPVTGVKNIIIHPAEGMTSPVMTLILEQETVLIF